MPKNAIILGAGGRDFHNFLLFFKDNPYYNVVCFTASQIPDIEKRCFPKELAGNLYKKDIPIYHEMHLPKIIKKLNVTDTFLCYSDLSHVEVMHKASIANAAGANFTLLGSAATMLKSKKPVIAVCAARTGSGKSQTTRKISFILKKRGKKVVIIRHPMPYGNLLQQVCQRFKTTADLDRYKCTIEEREEYEGHINNGFIVYAGVDYGKILNEAEKEADVILWDGGNNDLPFYKPNTLIVVVDPHRAGHEMLYYPGETNFRLADVIIINKMDSADMKNVELIENNIKIYNPRAKVLKANSRIEIDRTNIKPREILIVEDGPTLTHGGMKFGAGFVAAERFFPGAKIVHPNAAGSIKDIYKKFRHLTNILPAMGYNNEQVKELEKTINNTKCDLVLVATPINIQKLIKINKPVVNVRYELEEIGNTLESVI